MIESAWTNRVARTSIASFPTAPATARLIALPSALTIPHVDAAQDGLPAPAPPPATLLAADVQRLLHTRLTLDAQLSSSRTAARPARLGATRGPWPAAAGDDGPALSALHGQDGSGSLTIGLGQKWLEGRSRRIAPALFGPVPNMASFLMARGARVGDDGFVIPTLQWRPARNLRMGLDVPVATNRRADNWGIVGRLSIGF